MLRPKKVVFKKRWALLRDSFSKLLSLTEFHATASTLLADVYDVCNALPTPFDDNLFAELQNLFQEHLMLSHDNVLVFYGQHWDRFKLGATCIDEVCRYLNKRLEAPGKGEPLRSQLQVKNVTVFAAAMHLWKVHMIDEVKEKHSNRIMYQVFEEIRRDRDGERADMSAVAKVVQSLSSVSEFGPQGKATVFESEFEQPLVAFTRTYYSREAANLISTLSMSDYMRKVDKFLTEESTRANGWGAVLSTDSSVQNKVVSECEQQMIAKHTERFYTECRRLVENELTEDLSRMYQLLSRIPDVFKPMLKVIEDYVVEIGLKAVESLGEQAVKEPEEYVNALLKVHGNFTGMVDKAVRGDHMFTASIDMAFRIIVNDAKRHPSVKGAELIARYCDVVLKKSVKTITDLEQDEKLNKGILLFKYVDDKDLFQKFYSRLMARRLIFASSASDEAESNMIAKLKSACGIEYTTKLQRMFTDVNISKELVENFRGTIENKNEPELNVIVLTAGAWPLTQSSITGQIVPIELERSITAFQQFYNKRFNGRKLTWLYHLSRGDVKVNYLKKRYELQLSYFQTCVLLCFNQGVSFTLGELVQQTQLAEVELVRIIKSFLEIKLFLVSDSDLSATSVVKLNMDFSNKRTKIKVTGAVLGETKEEIQQTHKQVDVDRLLYLQALIVRIMKTRKHLGHNQLVEQTIREASSRFAPSIPMIKKVIEGLIEKAYVERDENNHDEYLYMA